MIFRQIEVKLHFMSIGLTDFFKGTVCQYVIALFALVIANFPQCTVHGNLIII